MTSTDFSEEIKELLKNAEQEELSNPIQGFVYAEKALALARQYKQYYAECLALLTLGALKESLAENTAETEALLTQTIELAQQHRFNELLTRALSKIASLLSSNNRMAEATDYIEQAKAQLKSISHHSPGLELLVLYDDINIRYRKGEAGVSLLTDCLDGLQASVETKNEGLHTGFLQVLTMLTAKMGDLEASINYSNQFIAIEERRNYHMALVGAYVFQSGIYEKLKNHTEAKLSLEKAVASARKLGDVRSYIFVETRRVNFLISNRQFEEAANLCNQLLAMSETSEMPKIRFDVVTALAQIADAKNNTSEAIRIFEAERSVFQEDKVSLQTITNHLHQLYAKQENYQLAYMCLLENKTINQDIYNTEKTKEYAELHARFETKEKESQLRETQLQMLDAELKALKSQMNPHFAFNTLKTVDNLLALNEVEQARKSLQSFAQLMRATLEQSNNELTLVEDELILLNNYISLEQNASGNSFEYTIEVDDSIDISYERVPSIFIQPIVENAIKHGLRHKQDNKHLRIQFLQSATGMHVVVADTGIGRTASAKLNKVRINHQSYAGNALEKRIELLNNKAGYEKYCLRIEDLYEGTKVTLSILNSPS